MSAEGGTGETYDGNQDNVKLILLGDSAVGKSKLVERYLLDDYVKQQMSTYALTLFSHTLESKSGVDIHVDVWDTAGQERFKNIHASYFFGAHVCIFVFDITRRQTYKNLETWWEELQAVRPCIPCIVAANKIDLDESVTQRNFNFATKRNLKLQFVSAASGVNVVDLFTNAIEMGAEYKKNPHQDDVETMLMEELKLMDDKEEAAKAGDA